MHPYGDPINAWVVTKIHAQYLAPDTRDRGLDPWGKPIRRWEYSAYLVDLDGREATGLPDLVRVLLHQVPPVKWWYIKQVDDAYLEKIEKYRVDRSEQ